MKALNRLLTKINEKLYRAVEDRDLSELSALAGGIRTQIVGLYSLDNVPELEKMLHKYQKWMEGAASAFDSEEENIAYQMGLLGGAIAAVAQLSEQKRQVKEYEVAHLDTKYQDEIIEHLMEKEYVQHNQLAKSLGISPSQLTTIMGKVDGEQQNIISMSRIGKFKYYCLTDMGRRYYCNQHRGNFREEILELLKSVLDRRKLAKRNTIIKFVDRYYMDDIELKRKAMEVEYFLDSLEAKNKEVFKKTIKTGGEYSYVKKLMAVQVASNIDTPIALIKNQYGHTIQGPSVFGDMQYMFANSEYEKADFGDMILEGESING